MKRFGKKRSPDCTCTDSFTCGPCLAAGALIAPVVHDLREALRADKIKALEAAGRLDPSCPTCVEIFYPYWRTGWPGSSPPFAPAHKASDRCRSGKNPHCTCDTCF